MRTRGHAELLRAVPRVAPVQPLLLTAALAGAFVLTAANAPAAAFRLRIGSAVVAAALCFVLDDDAATTLASVPVSRLTRRSIRAGGAAAFVLAWFAVVLLAADALTGVGRPPTAVLVEVGALALIACAVACVAIGRTDDGRGGIAGAFAAMVCFASAYLPPHWWMPFTAEPRVTRLAIVSAGALVVALTASADVARRRRWTR
jgi:hypothetical protein